MTRRAQRLAPTPSYPHDSPKSCRGKWSAAKPRHIIAVTHACLRRRATGPIRAVPWWQFRQRKRIASSAPRLRGWVLGWVGTSAGTTRACRPQVLSCRDEQPRAIGVVTQPHPSENLPGQECASRRSWRPRRRRLIIPTSGILVSHRGDSRIRQSGRRALFCRWHPARRRRLDAGRPDCVPKTRHARLRQRAERPEVAARKSTGEPQGPPSGSAQHPDQRPVACRLSLDGGRTKGCGHS